MPAVGAACTLSTLLHGGLAAGPCGLLSHGLCAGSATSVTPFQKGSTGTYFPVKLSRPRRLETRATSGTAGAWMPLGVVKPSPREACPASPFLAATCAPPWGASQPGYFVPLEKCPRSSHSAFRPAGCRGSSTQADVALSFWHWPCLLSSFLFSLPSPQLVV